MEVFWTQIEISHKLGMIDYLCNTNDVKEQDMMCGNFQSGFVDTERKSA